MTEDLKLYDRLVGSAPLHASPTEHQGTPQLPQFDPEYGGTIFEPSQTLLCGNFHPAWGQFRKTLANENQPIYLPSAQVA